MIEGDAGAIEGLLNRWRDLGSIPVGGDGDGPAVVQFDQRGANILRDRVRIGAPGHLAVLYVPPH